MQFSKEQWDNVWPWLKNKYVIVSVLFFVWLLFIDRNDLITQFKLKSQVRDLEKEKAYYQEEIATLEENSKDLFTDPKKLETFAREEYLMKKDNEDVFVIVEEEK